MTIDEVKDLAACELRETDFRSQGDFAAAFEARAVLCHALGEALAPDPPMQIVLEALQRANEYRKTISSLATRSEDLSPREAAREASPSPADTARQSEPVLMTPAEATAMLSWQRPDLLSPPRPTPPPAAPLKDPVAEDPPEGVMDLLWDLGYDAGAFVRRLFGGGG